MRQETEDFRQELAQAKLTYPTRQGKPLAITLTNKTDGLPSLEKEFSNAMQTFI